MEILVVLALAGAFIYFRNRDQQQRIALLGAALQPLELEKLMETLMDGYLRALGETSAERQAQVWSYLATQEERVCTQVEALVEALAPLWSEHLRVSTLPVAIPRATQLFPQAAFDLRKALQIHAQGIADAVRLASPERPKDRAFAITAELMLLQHTCHWYCRSKAVASARLMARHKTRYEQVLESIGPKTRSAYLALTGAPAR